MCAGRGWRAAAINADNALTCASNARACAVVWAFARLEARAALAAIAPTLALLDARKDDARRVLVWIAWDAIGEGDDNELALSVALDVWRAWPGHAGVLLITTTMTETTCTLTQQRALEASLVDADAFERLLAQQQKRIEERMRHITRRITKN